jgi:excisionase family DNA binding protein
MAHIDPVNERWQSVDAVAEHLGVVRDTVYRWIERKGLPANRVGRLWKFKLSDVDAWVRSGGADESASVLRVRTAARRTRADKRTRAAR